MSKQLTKNIPIPPITTNMAAQSLHMMVSAIREHHALREQEETKRTAIREQSRVAIERIRAETSIVREYLHQSFAERRENFTQWFDLLDRAMEKGDTAAMQVALTGIVELTRQHPLADALNALQQMRSGEQKRIEI